MTKASVRSVVGDGSWWVARETYYIYHHIRLLRYIVLMVSGCVVGGESDARATSLPTNVVVLLPH